MATYRLGAAYRPGRAKPDRERSQEAQNRRWPRDVNLDASAIGALKAQRLLSEAKGPRIWLNARDGQPCSTNARVRKTF